jgi:hypothetical protein
VVRTLKNSGFFRTLLVGQYEAIKKKLPETANNRLAQGSSGGTTCPRGSDSHLSAQGNFRGTACPRGSSSHLLAQGSSRAGTCPLGSSTRLPVQGSSRGAVCPYNSGSDENRRAEQLRK